MKSRIPILLIVLIFLTGVGIYFYPDISFLINEASATAEIAAYQKTTNGLTESEMNAKIIAARGYNDSVSDVLSVDPFQTGLEDPSASDETYRKILSVDGIMGYIDIPKIDVYLPVYPGTSSEVLKKGAGHLYGSALPVGGKGTHSVISAHRGLPTARLFTRLDELKEGDIFYYHILNRILAYQVDQIKVIEPTELENLNPVPDKDYMTLFTCTPYGINSHRLLVRGVRIPYEVVSPDVAAAQAEAGGPRMQAKLPGWIPAAAAAAGITALLILAGGLTAWKKAKRKKSDKGKREV